MLNGTLAHSCFFILRRMCFTWFLRLCAREQRGSGLHQQLGSSSFFIFFNQGNTPCLSFKTVPWNGPSPLPRCLDFPVAASMGFGQETSSGGGSCACLSKVNPDLLPHLNDRNHVTSVSMPTRWQTLLIVSTLSKYFSHLLQPYSGPAA